MMTVADWYAADSYAAGCSWIEEKFPSPPPGCLTKISKLPLAKPYAIFD